MPLHIIGNRILTDEEFKEERDASSKWILPTIGYFGVILLVGFLFPIWTADNPWFPFPFIFLAWWRAGLFEIFGMISIFVFLSMAIFGGFSEAV